MDPSFEARVVRVDHEGSTPLSDGDEILPCAGPIWEAGGATRPAAFELGKARSTLTVRVEAGGASASEAYVLRGALGPGLAFEGRVRGEDLARCPATVEVALVAEPSGFTGRTGDIAWEITPARGGPSSPAGRTRLELYWISTDAYALFWRGPPVALLRALAGALGARTADALAVAEVTEWIFRNNPPRYDSLNGSSSYVDTPGWWDCSHVTLHLGSYLAAHADPHATCNCFDLAAVLQLFLWVLGPRAAYCTIHPFGYLALTGLVGRGPSNNPLFLYPPPESPVIAPKDPARTAFSCHCFCYVLESGHVADATAGPHYGSEPLHVYVRRATDGVTPKPPVEPRGTASDVLPFRGVVRVDLLTSGGPDERVPQVASFARLVGSVGTPPTAPPARGVVCQWPDPLACLPVENGPWEIAHVETLAGEREARRRWRFQRGAEQVKLELYVASDGAATARERLLALGSMHTSPTMPFTAGPPTLAPAARWSTPGRSGVLFAFHNVVCKVQAIETSVDPEAIAMWVHAQAAAALVEDVVTRLPEIGDVTVSPTPAPRGLPIEVVAAIDPDDELIPIFDTAALRLLTLRRDALTFLALRAGDTEITLVALDPTTLRVATRSLRVTVTG